MRSSTHRVPENVENALGAQNRVAYERVTAMTWPDFESLAEIFWVNNRRKK